MRVRPVSLAALITLATLAATSAADDASNDASSGSSRAAQARELVREFCFDCHGDGADEGDLSLDQFATHTDSAEDRALGWKVLKNIRAGVMPPSGEAVPTEEQKNVIADWIKFDVVEIDADHPDPGRLPVRRLNRVEYGNTVNDLMGIEFDAHLMFPADDSGHGFDNVGDALSFSPMLMEKFLKAARIIVAEAVPTQTKIVPLQVFESRDFQDSAGETGKSNFSGKQPHELSRSFTLNEAGTYALNLTLKLDGSFNFDPARYKVDFFVDGEFVFSKEYGWDDGRLIPFQYEYAWEAGEHSLRISIAPIASQHPDEDSEDRSTDVRLEIEAVRIAGPTATKRLVHPANYKRFFTRDHPPESMEAKRVYAAEVLRRFAARAFRSEVGIDTVESLVQIAESTYAQPGKSFEAGVARAMVAVLSSPRFLFHLEASGDVDHSSERAHGPVSELALASRMSYFLWSTLPDDELLALAEENRLRENLRQQINRMIADDRGRDFIQNFVGQWLRTRDITQSAVDSLAVHGLRKEYDDVLDAYRKARLARGLDEERSPEEERMRERFREIRKVSDRYGRELKEAMRRETEMCVEHIVSEDGTLLDLLDADYTFLNEPLAKHYGIEGVEGDEMRRVDLAEGSPRGGVLTHAGTLLVTSNPTRTSPVKRGLFVLDNLLGTPAPPAPAGVPELEDAAGRFGDRKPTLRELLAAHREASICASCHARMDPIGLALENFNALGEWREIEHGQPIDPAGELITGERFADAKELKQVLRGQHADDFYRCVTEKLLTYALGRGVEYGDQHAIDLIVEELHHSGGKMSALLEGVIRSSPFQNRRYPARNPSNLSSK